MFNILSILEGVGRGRGQTNYCLLHQNVLYIWKQKIVVDRIDRSYYLQAALKVFLPKILEKSFNPSIFQSIWVSLFLQILQIY